MGKFFSIFSRGDTLADGSYCEKSTGTHHNYLEGTDIDEEMASSARRGDEDLVLDTFNDKAVNYRWNEYGEPAEEGPRRRNGEL